jgi:NADP-dependent 3-hydroxy acid dehydrogenase YdfG
MNTTPKVALVTGASSGFGQATAALLTAQGFLVFGTSRAPAHNAAV